MQKKNKITNKAIALVRQGKLNIAQKLVKKNKKNSTVEESWLTLADICKSGNMLKAYMQCCENSLKVNPGFALAYSCLGFAYAGLQKKQEAMSYSTKALQMEVDNHIIQYNHAYILQKYGEYDKAAQHFVKSLSINENDAVTHSRLANCYQIMGNLYKSEFHYLESLKYDPNNIDSLIGLGFFYQNQGDMTKSLEYFDQALSVEPDSKVALGAKADVLVKLVRKEEAYNIIRKLIDSGNTTSMVIQVYSSVYSEFGDINEAIRLGKSLLLSKNLSVRDKSVLCYSLGLMLDKTKQYDQAFENYALANKINFGGFDVQSYVDYTQRIIDVYNPDFYNACIKNTDTFNKPIFILGMPRSGTSLVEQVLSEHSTVHAGGELPYMGSIIRRLSGSAAVSKIQLESITNFSDTDIVSMASEYKNQIEALSSDAKRITDKLPSNYLYIGLISQLFPNAKIIHTRRDPRDTCLSIFFQDFGPFQPYSDNLSNIAHVYIEYDRLMRHWADILNIQMLDLHYEEFVSDFEQKARGLLRYCDLDWEDSCLEFYKSKRSVATASFNQVNKPIYNQSVARWKHYEKYIAEIEDILEPVL